MALAALNTYTLSSHADSFPQPLQIQKKPRKTTFHSRVFRKSPHHERNDQYAYGPLDDIIDEIKTNIWESPHDYNTALSLCGWVSPLTLPSTWTATPLPLSRTPSNQPLTIRKHRENRSSTSAQSSMGDPMYFSGTSSQNSALDGGPVGAPVPTGVAPWPLFDAPTSYDAPQASSISDTVDRFNYSQANEPGRHNVEETPLPSKRRPSRLRLFTGFTRLRHSETGETSGSSGDTSDLASPTTIETRIEEGFEGESLREPSDDAVEAYVRRHARNGARLGSIIGRIARRLPPPVDYRHDDLDTQNASPGGNTPTTLRTAVRIFSEVTLLFQAEQQEFWVAVEVEGALYNRSLLPDSTIDIIFVVDNAYYVSRECLSRALDAANSALHHLNRADRLALYATHCTHQSVSGNRPDLLFPLQPFGADAEETFRSVVATVGQYGTQSWKPPRPNPLMAEVILGVVRSLERTNLKSRRTHVVLLSPAAHILHDVSKSRPDLYIHQVNPAAVPFRRFSEVGEPECHNDCCKNVFISNWGHFQSLPGRMKRIVKYARSLKPVGEITKVCIDVRAKDGCKITECVGLKDIANLRLGQVHTIFAKLQITRSAMRAVDLLSKNPVFNSSLDHKELRQQLQNAAIVGAVKAHLLDVQVYHQNSLHATDCWNYTETPFLVIRDLGGLAPPFDTTMEALKRRLFHKFVQLDAFSASIDAEAMLSSLTEAQGLLTKFVNRILKEVDHHQQVFEYEQDHRQKLPLCPGPITIEATPHEWLSDLWNRNKTKRRGVAVAENEELSGLIDRLHGPERLG